MATLFINRSGYTLPSMPVNKGGSIMGNEETTGKATRPLAPGEAALAVPKPGKVHDGGGVDAELAAAGWRPYRDPRKETA